MMIFLSPLVPSYALPVEKYGRSMQLEARGVVFLSSFFLFHDPGGKKANLK